MRKKTKRRAGAGSNDHVVTAKAVGFASYPPTVLVVFGAYSSTPTKDQVFVFPPKDDHPFTLPEQTRGNNYVLMLAPDRMAELKAHASKIHRLLVFGRPDELEPLGVPVVDVEIKNGRMGEGLKQTAQSLRDKIENHAIDLALVAPSRKKKPKPVPVTTPADEEPSKKNLKPLAGSLLERLRRLKKAFDGSKLQFEDTIMIPTILRLVREITRAEFAQNCDALTSYSVPAKIADRFHSYIEEQTAKGKTLGRAVRLYLWPKKLGRRLELEALAEKYGCAVIDLRLVVLSVKRLQETLA